MLLHAKVRWDAACRLMAAQHEHWLQRLLPTRSLWRRTAPRPVQRVYPATLHAELAGWVGRLRRGGVPAHVVGSESEGMEVVQVRRRLNYTFGPPACVRFS